MMGPSNQANAELDPTFLMFSVNECTECSISDSHSQWWDECKQHRVIDSQIRSALSARSLVAWSVCLFCWISVHLGWLFVFVRGVCFCHDWLLAVWACLPCITITIIIIIDLIKAVTRWLSPVIMSHVQRGRLHEKTDSNHLRFSDAIWCKMRGELGTKLMWNSNDQAASLKMGLTC